jgi:hypothetical protein
VQREPHRGKGGAVKAGLLAAKGSYRFMCDADLSMPISELKSFCRRCLDGYEVAIGTREGIAARRVGEPRSRHLVGRMFIPAIVQRLCRARHRRLAVRVQDVHRRCGARHFSAGHD